MTEVWTLRRSEEFPDRVLFSRDYLSPLLLSCGVHLQLMGYCLGPAAAPADLKSILADLSSDPQRLWNDFHRFASGSCQSSVSGHWPPTKDPRPSQKQMNNLSNFLQTKCKFSIERAAETFSFLESCVKTAAWGESSLYAALSGTALKVNTADRLRTGVRFLYWALKDRFESGFKFLTAYVAAICLKQEAPPRPQWLPDEDIRLYGGVTRSRLQKLLTRGERTLMPLAQSLLMAKRATAPVSERFVEGEYVQHEKRLRAEPPAVPWWFPREIRRTVDEVFRRPFSPGSTLKIPSERAHFGWSRKRLGAFGALVQPPDDIFADPEESRYLGILRENDPRHAEAAKERLCSIVSFSVYSHSLPELLVMYERAGRVVEVRGFGSLVEERITDRLERDTWYKRGKKVVVQRRDTTDGRPAEMGPPVAEPSAVLEACKVRMITKGPVKQQYFGKYLQSFLWRSVQHHPTFRLIGQPLQAGDIDCFLGHCPVGSYYLSGDYKAATDYISASCTTLCWEEICRRCRIDPFWEELGHEILTDHRMVSMVGPSYDQSNGQLMGSVVSFPILCLINACVNRYVMETAYGRPFSLRDTGMLINGDDCLLHLPPRAYGLWQQATKNVGLIMSAGKNYFSDRFVVINSRMFAYRPEYGVWNFQHGIVGSKIVPFINPGNLHGVGRVMGGEDQDENRTGFLSRCDSLLEESPAALREQLIDTWVYLQADRLKKIAAPGQNWFLPRFCGGLGVPRPVDFPISKVSLDARRVMRYMCSLDGQDVSWSLSLESADAPEYAARGCSVMGQWSRVLGLRSRVVPDEEALEFRQAEVERASFAQFALYGAVRRGTTLSHVFRDMCKKSRHVEPANGFPRYNRVVLRSGLSVPPITSNIRLIAETFLMGRMLKFQEDWEFKPQFLRESVDFLSLKQQLESEIREEDRNTRRLDAARSCPRADVLNVLL